MRRMFIVSIIAGLALSLSCSGDKKDPFLFLPLGQESTEPGTTTTVETPDGTTVDSTNDDETSDGSFDFDTVHDVAIEVTVTDNNGPVVGAVVKITDPETGDTILFQGITDSNGQVIGSITIPNTETNIELSGTVGSQTVVEAIDPSNLTKIKRTIHVNGTVVVIPQTPDADGDGFADTVDAYPDDPSRATKVVTPAGSIAFEDLYPSAGDSDFNDYVLYVENEQDLNAAGKVVRIRGKYTHIARGAGYKHKLMLTVPNAGSVSVSKTIYKSSGSVASSSSGSLSGISSYEILGDSSETISQSNTSSDQTYKPGRRAEVEFILDTPIAGSNLGKAPYDLYMYVISTSKEVHFPGRYFDGDGKDIYMDANGFPWALQVPSTWNWPLETKNISGGYSQFAPWYLSLGVDSKDWYNYPNNSDLFQAFNNGGLTAFMTGKVNASVLTTISLIGLVGLFAIVLYRTAMRRQN